MLCELCRQNEATIHITKIVNGVKKEANICSKCAGNSEEFNLVSDMDIITPFSFQNILGGLMDYVNDTSKSSRIAEIKCENCGASYREFKEKGLLGCSECYKYFSPAILSVVKGVQGNTEHIGKIPKRSGKDLVNKNKILKLKEELQKAIALEEYEKAAEIRDKIRDIDKENQ
ncbi:UvrB/UvrC motif-containing protein [Clostridium botulinum]|uniref:Excinuclease n=1 Tax=Clostridium botulinum C/D str. DC5 TaxID=1443128 RepID=A0A0A0IM53_CLOBO|nr:UvrB/UvrC motif-containing protein [Clostridium botulinum]KEI05061.1 excinuclease [Clostridium botulinum C/D str. BKT75002]KEI11905.1 excinuclease [Clostridium botulinum C/D str. BKT2873]KGM93896.1 excinuclease [Clostridium botulinum D str. CCUG 7971]KGN01694.1 excinuclease [Clostridium botulinum C/D str. DC5]KOC48839.1 excinuclease [Clostridium botulinum]